MHALRPRSPRRRAASSQGEILPERPMHTNGRLAPRRRQHRMVRRNARARGVLGEDRQVLADYPTGRDDALQARFWRKPEGSPDAQFPVYSYLNECNWDAARSVAEEMTALRGSGASEAATRARLVLAYAYAHGERSESARLMQGINARSLRDAESRWRHELASLALDALRKPLGVLLARVDRAAELGRKVGVAAVAYAFTEGVELALCHGDLALAQKYRVRATEFAERNTRGVAKLPQELVKNAARLSLCAGRLADARALLVSNLRWRDSGRYNEAYHAGIGVFVGLRTGDPSMVDAFFDPALLPPRLRRATQSSAASCCPDSLKSCAPGWPARCARYCEPAWNVGSSTRTFASRSARLGTLRSKTSIGWSSKSMRGCARS